VVGSHNWKTARADRSVSCNRLRKLRAKSRHMRCDPVVLVFLTLLPACSPSHHSVMRVPPPFPVASAPSAPL